MKIILGIGNPGKSYYRNRHNAGLLFVQWLANKNNLRLLNSSKTYVSYTISNDKILCASLVYMNLSGKAIQSIKRKHPMIKPEDVLVVHDDLQHKLGNVRIKEGGSFQGHNGLSSICSSIKSKGIKKLQLGIDRPVSHDPEIVAKYVLTDFSSSQFEILQNSFPKALELAKKHQFI